MRLTRVILNFKCEKDDKTEIISLKDIFLYQGQNNNAIIYRKI